MSAEVETMGVRIDPDVFVSHRRTDKEFVERFVSALEGYGPEVWWDVDVGAGDDWRESIVENLAASDCLVAAVSKGCNDSTQLVKELAVADHMQKVVIPVKIDDARPTGSFLYELAWRNWIGVYPDPTSKLDAAAARIVESLKEAGWRPPPARSPAPSAPVDAPRRSIADSVPAPSRFRVREAFPIRYYRRRANPSRVARNLVVSNLTFVVGGALAGLLSASSLVVFFALSKNRATHELRSRMETV